MQTCMQTIEQTLDSREVAEMLETEHWKLLRKLEGNKKSKGIVTILADNNFVVSDFFIPSMYKDSSGKENKCYKVTKKGCEFLANKFNGEKGVLFTARYINRFHEMQDMITGQAAGQQIPWFIRKFGKEGYIMLFRDFEAITGICLDRDKPFWKAHHEVINSRHPLYWNGWAWYTTVDREEFLKEYGFDYGDDKCMDYFYPCGVRKALQLCREDKNLKLEQSAYEMITEGLKAVQPPKKKEIPLQNQSSIVITKENEQSLPVQINIICSSGLKGVL